MGRHSRPDGPQHRHNPGRSTHLVSVPPPSQGRHRAGPDGPVTEYQGRHQVGGGSGPYEGRHRARHETETAAGHASWATESYQSARRAVVATTVATTLTAGGIVGLMWHHTGLSGRNPGRTDAVELPRIITRLSSEQALVGEVAATGENVRTATRLATSTSPAPRATSRPTPSAPRSASHQTRATVSRPHTQSRIAPGRSNHVRTTARPAPARRVAPAHPAPKWVRPGTGVISSCYCERWGTFHWGVDLAAPYGAPIYAAGDGVVLRAGPATGFGQAVYIQHANGDTTVYGHMETILVSVGQRVSAGQKIALVGAEGEATGPHLHFEVHQGSEYGPKVNPVTWLAARRVHL